MDLYSVTPAVTCGLGGGGFLLKRPPRIDSRLKNHKQVVLKTCSNLDPHWITPLWANLTRSSKRSRTGVNMTPGSLCFEHYCIGGRNMAGLKKINPRFLPKCSWNL